MQPPPPPRRRRRAARRRRRRRGHLQARGAPARARRPAVDFKTAPAEEPTITFKASTARAARRRETATTRRRSRSVGPLARGGGPRARARRRCARRAADPRAARCSRGAASGCPSARRHRRRCGARARRPPAETSSPEEAAGQSAADVAAQPEGPRLHAAVEARGQGRGGRESAAARAAGAEAEARPTAALNGARPAPSPRSAPARRAPARRRREPRGQQRGGGRPRGGGAQPGGVRSACRAARSAARSRAAGRAGRRWPQPVLVGRQRRRHVRAPRHPRRCSRPRARRPRPRGPPRRRPRARRRARRARPRRPSPARSASARRGQPRARARRAVREALPRRPRRLVRSSACRARRARPGSSACGCAGGGGPGAETVESYANEITLLERLRGDPAIIELVSAEVDRSNGIVHMVMELGDIDLAGVIQRANSAARRRRRRGARRALAALRAADVAADARGGRGHPRRAHRARRPQARELPLRARHAQAHRLWDRARDLERHDQRVPRDAGRHAQLHEPRGDPRHVGRRRRERQAAAQARPRERRVVARLHPLPDGVRRDAVRRAPAHREAPGDRRRAPRDPLRPPDAALRRAQRWRGRRRRVHHVLARVPTREPSRRATIDGLLAHSSSTARPSTTLYEPAPADAARARGARPTAAPPAAREHAPPPRAASAPPPTSSAARRPPRHRRAPRRLARGRDPDAAGPAALGARRSGSAQPPGGAQGEDLRAVLQHGLSRMQAVRSDDTVEGGAPDPDVCGRSGTEEGALSPLLSTWPVGLRARRLQVGQPDGRVERRGWMGRISGAG